MQISSSSVYNSHNASKQASFNGLYVKCKLAEFGGRTNKTQWQSYFYYPFKNEVPCEFDKFASAKNFEQVVPVDVNWPEWGKVRKVVSCVKKDILPFTKEQWTLYKDNLLDSCSDTCKGIDNALKKLKLDNKRNDIGQT